MGFKNYILVCGGTGCESSRADQIYRSLIEEAKAQGVAEQVQVIKTGCFGFCEQGPIVKILPEDSFYVQVKPEDAKELILSPHTEADLVRCFIRDSKFVIDKEGMVYDAGKYYVVIHARKADENELHKMYAIDGIDEDNRDYQHAKDIWKSYIRFGKLLIQEKSDVFIEFLTKEINTYKNILAGLENNKTEAGIKRRQEVESLINLAELAKP